ncbi:NAD(P)H-dependent oxidoreductase [uncultured Bacteroides sp.]|uniref:NAD(P)H-dependent oxidoreductase n=1 Tax=uncultured Bacteroides sp. TaxID=162156 RepID=UPI002AA6E9AF|nr:NAD(P)H-dependent oxidoreductase [uncultured Bacteroides sp.]
MSKKVVVLVAHPNMSDSVANKALMNGIQAVQGVEIIELYKIVSNPFDSEFFRKELESASALVFQFPFYWASSPSLLKKWLDEVFTPFTGQPFVVGKSLMVVTTTGSEADAYSAKGRNFFTVEELLRPFQLVANHSGMNWCAPLVVYGMTKEDVEQQVSAGVEEYKKRITGLLEG